MVIKDLFSTYSKQYAIFRPTYPPKLFDFIFNHVKQFELAWDCATGNGQAAKELAKRFKQVNATDISAKQIESAAKRDNILYSLGQAEKTFRARRSGHRAIHIFIHFLTNGLKSFVIEYFEPTTLSP
jgi:tRNA/tmRNA/rRNA uracil-C5-methylase (TrmA/RlmC/RlmD family)